MKGNLLSPRRILAPYTTHNEPNLISLCSVSFPCVAKVEWLLTDNLKLLAGVMAQKYLSPTNQPTIAIIFFGTHTLYPTLEIPLFPVHHHITNDANIFQQFHGTPSSTIVLI